jgi:hypothetical protein
MNRSTPILLFVLCATGCSFHARDENEYRKVTRALIETRSTDVKTCYDTELKTNPNASGTVIVRFTVQQETGQVIGAAMDEVASSAPASLGQCIVNALGGLVLDPPDARDGNATFQWEFKLGQTG